MGLFRSAEKRKTRKEKKRELEMKIETLPVTTADFKQEYSIISVIQAESLTGLKEKALDLGADALTGIGFYGYDQQCYGTAIIFRRDEVKLPSEQEDESPLLTQHEINESLEGDVSDDINEGEDDNSAPE